MVDTLHCYHRGVLLPTQGPLLYRWIWEELQESQRDPVVTIVHNEISLCPHTKTHQAVTALMCTLSRHSHGDHIGNGIELLLKRRTSG